MFLEFLGTKIMLWFYVAVILCKLASVLFYPKTLLPTVQLVILFLLLYSFVKYYAILVMLSLLLSENLCKKILKHFSPNINYGCHLTLLS